MLGKKAIRMFFKGFLQSFFIVALLLTAGVLGYKLTMKQWQASGEDAILAYQDDTFPESITEATEDVISKNLIYCYDEDTHEINKILLEIFQSKDRKLNYVTIPMRTQLTMSDTLYRKMVLVDPEIPQVMLLSSITKYLDQDTLFDYGVLLMEDLLGIDISYYTVIPQSTYDTIFTGKIPDGTDDYTASEGDSKTSGQALPIETFTGEYTGFLNTIKTSDDLRSYIASIYPSLKTNLSLDKKLDYLDSYFETPLSNISFELLEGNNQNSAFLIDTVLAGKRLKELTGG